MNMLDTYAKQLSKPLEDLFAKAPALPASVKEFLVSVAPWLSLIGGVILVLVVGVMGLMASTSPVYQFAAAYGGSTFTMQMMLSAGIAIVSGVFMLLAFAPLKKRAIRGWNLMFWGEIISLISNLVTLSIVGFIVGGLIGFYILFQVKSYYK